MFMRNTINIFAALLIASAFALTPARAQFSPGSGNGGTFTGPFPGNPIDPTILFGAGTSALSTTGTISNGSNSLVVTSPTDIRPGLAIAVENAGGTAGNNPLQACVSSSYVSGTTVLLVVCGSSTAANATATATGQSVWRDDTAALQSAINLAQSTGRPIQIQAGNYVTAGTPLTISSNITMRGAGKFITTFYNIGKTNDVISVINTRVTLSDFIVYQNLSGPSGLPSTPTAGYGINLVGIAPTVCSPMTANIDNIEISNVSIQWTYNGMHVGPGISASAFNSIYMYIPFGPYGVYYEDPTPCGGNHFNDLAITSGAVGVGDFVIFAADLLWLTRINLESGPNIHFLHDADHVFIISPSLEANSQNTPCGIDFGAFTNVIQVAVSGGEIAFYQHPFCNANTNLGGSAVGTVAEFNGSGGSGFNDGGNGVLNYQWPAPVITGCTPSGTPAGISDALTGTVAVTCSSQTLTMTFNTHNTGVPLNGWLCPLYHADGTLIPQTGWAKQTVGPPYWGSAIFANVTTTPGEIIRYNGCRQF